jgi:hypothetical protein
MTNTALYDLDKRERLFKEPQISSYLPFLINGKHTCSSLNGYCGTCNTVVADEDFRGSLDRSFKDVIIVEAVSICSKCKQTSCYMFRVYADMRLMIYRNKQWETISMIEKPSIMKRFTNLFSFKI